MKIFPCSFAALAICIAPVLHADAQTNTNTPTIYGGQSGAGVTSIRINGTSTAHDWETEGTVIGGTIEFAAGVNLDKSQAAPSGLQGDKIPVKARVLIPVASIHSKAEHMPEVMDDLMQKAMKAGDFRIIEFTLKEMTFKGPHTAGKPFDVNVAGNLAIAGRTNAISFPVTIEPLDGGKIKVSGSAPVKMTAYGIEPPAPNLVLGLMKCGDDVKITFSWTLKEKK